MEIKITMPDDRLNEILDKEVDAFNPEDIKNIFMECIREYFRQNDYTNIDKIIIRGRYYDNTTTLTDFTRNLIRSCDYSKMQEIVDISIEKLKENYDDILRKIIQETLINGFMDSYMFRQGLENTVRDVMIKNSNS